MVKFESFFDNCFIIIKTNAKEVEAYILEDKPRKVKKMIKKYCL